MADENDGVEVSDEPVAGIHEAITDEPDKSLEGLDKDETLNEVDSDGEIDTEIDTDVDTDEQPGAVAKPAPTLPNAHRRSLKAYGWDDAEIDQNLAALGPAFMATAARIHKNRNDEVKGYADAGRQARQQQNQPAPQTAEVPGLKPIDIAALKAKYGEADLIDQMAVPYNALLQEFNKILPVIQQTRQRAQQAELESISRQLDSYFEAADKDLYGTAKTKSETQIAARNEILTTADAIMYGMKKQGREVSMNDALDMAIDSMTGDTKEAKARTKIKASLQTRNKGISLRPSGKSDVTLNRGKIRGRGDLENKVSRGLAALFPQT